MSGVEELPGKTALLPVSLATDCESSAQSGWSRAYGAHADACKTLFVTCRSLNPLVREEKI